MQYAPFGSLLPFLELVLGKLLVPAPAVFAAGMDVPVLVECGARCKHAAIFARVANAGEWGYAWTLAPKKGPSTTIRVIQPPACTGQFLCNTSGNR